MSDRTPLENKARYVLGGVWALFLAAYLFGTAFGIAWSLNKYHWVGFYLPFIMFGGVALPFFLGSIYAHYVTEPILRKIAAYDNRIRH